MAKNLLDQAQICEDDFYQTYRPANAFFGINDFAAKLVDERDNLLEAEFKIQLNRNRNQFPVISPQWLSREMAEVKKDDQGRFYVDICTPLFEFPEDERGSGLQNVIPYGKACAEFIRITPDQVWGMCMLPATSTNFYSLEKCRIWLHNFYACTEKLEVVIVASQSGLSFENQSIPDGKAATIREIVINKMFRDYQVKLGKIQVVNDGNPNPQPNETGMIYEGLKTK